MSFAPVLGPESPSHAFIRSSISGYLSSLAALCSSGLATIFSWVDNLATRLPSSCCPVCLFKDLRRSNHSTETKNTALAVQPKDTKTTALVFDTGSKTYTLKKLEEIDGESTVQLVHNPSLVPLLTHHLHSGKSHLPQLSPHLRPIRQSAASWRIHRPLRSPN